MTNTSMSGFVHQRGMSGQETLTGEMGSLKGDMMTTSSTSSLYVALE